jgi:hypothetical protein
VWPYHFLLQFDTASHTSASYRYLTILRTLLVAPKLVNNACRCCCRFSLGNQVTAIDYLAIQGMKYSSCASIYPFLDYDALVITRRIKIHGGLLLEPEPPDSIRTTITLLPSVKEVAVGCHCRRGNEQVDLQEKVIVTKLGWEAQKWYRKLCRSTYQLYNIPNLDWDHCLSRIL